jgi:AhpD family alkylhydroperoxidase
VAPSDYPAYYGDLKDRIARLGREIPGPMAGFAELYRRGVADGALSPKVKALIAIPSAISACCDGCVAYHVHDARRSGASRQEIAEAVGVAVMMGGGPAVVHGAAALEALEQLDAVPAG